MKRKQLEVKTKLRIAKSPAEVFEAIVNPKKMSRYFLSSGSGRLDADATVFWQWAEVSGNIKVQPKMITKNKLISFLWSARGHEALVTISLLPAARGATVVSVNERGWPRNLAGIARCVEQTQGWTHMLCCLKAYLEHGINLRKGGVVT